MSSRKLKLWLIGAALLVVAVRIVWVTYMAQDHCLDAGGAWNAEQRSCQMPPSGG